MSAAFNTLEAEFVPLSTAWFPDVLRVENAAYTHPWVESNFTDSIRSGYQAQLLVAGGQLLGYFVAMRGVDVAVFHVEHLTVPALDAERCIVWMNRIP